MKTFQKFHKHSAQCGSISLRNLGVTAINPELHCRSAGEQFQDYNQFIKQFSSLSLQQRSISSFSPMRGFNVLQQLGNPFCSKEKLNMHTCKNGELCLCHSRIKNFHSTSKAMLNFKSITNIPVCSKPSCPSNCSNVCCCSGVNQISNAWNDWTMRSYRQRTNTQIIEICKGHKHFRDVTFPTKEKIYSDLIINGQKPKALFISCSDSRIIPDDLLNLQPGDLFVTRNVGAFVPPYHSLLDGYHSVGAVIEYAVNFLQVTDVIVCGHSHCGACAALFSPEFQKPKEEIPPEEYSKVAHLRNWLKLGAETREIVKERNIEDPILRQELTSRVSVVMQLSNLLSYPYIREKTDLGKLTLHGWYYDIEKGVVEYYDSNKKQFFDSLDLERRARKNGIPSAIEIDTTNPLDFDSNAHWSNNGHQN